MSLVLLRPPMPNLWPIPPYADRFTLAAEPFRQEGIVAENVQIDDTSLLWCVQQVAHDYSVLDTSFWALGDNRWPGTLKLGAGEVSVVQSAYFVQVGCRLAEPAPVEYTLAVPGALPRPRLVFRLKV